MFGPTSAFMSEALFTDDSFFPLMIDPLPSSEGPLPYLIVEFIGFDEVRGAITSFTLRSDPSVIPEPTTFIVWSLLGLTAGGISYRRNCKA